MSALVRAERKEIADAPVSSNSNLARPYSDGQRVDARDGHRYQRRSNANLKPRPISRTLAHQFWIRAQVGRRAIHRAMLPPANATAKFVGTPVT
jgi:hypothetical protein